MNYKKIYDNIINKRKQCLPQGYSEKHHILPRCFGGTDDKINIVKLTAREHFICHLLLIKIYKNTHYFYKAINMFIIMLANSDKQLRYINSRWYEIYRKDISQRMHNLQEGKNNSQYNTVWVSCLKAKKSIKILKTELQEYLDRGYIKKRIQNFTKYFEKQKIKEQCRKNSEYKFKDISKKYTEYYALYNKVGWKEFVNITQYPFSKQNFVTQLKKYVKEFIPQNGKKRGIK